MIPAYFAGPEALAGAFASGILAQEGNQTSLTALESGLLADGFAATDFQRVVALYQKTVAGGDQAARKKLEKDIPQQILRQRDKMKETLAKIRMGNQGGEHRVASGRAALTAEYLAPLRQNQTDQTAKEEAAHFYYPEKEIGQGAFATVYAGRDTNNRRVVIKALEGQPLSGSAVALEKFRREIDILRRLIHPNIIEILDWNTNDSPPFFVMEYVDGKGLDTYLEKGPLPWPLAKTVALQLASALAVVHAENVVHLDLKPNNILLPDEAIGSIRLIDFGIARDLDEPQPPEKSDVTWGTPYYISPEQITGKKVDPRSDIYSLGVVLYEMLTGKPPFRDGAREETFAMHLQAPPPPLRQAAPGVNIPPGAEAIVLKALAKSRDRRYQSMVEMFAALQACSG
ncbi:MAG: serine/threonine protein kinase [Deltaproteobacteria bacterium]|nr:serine/threonine protein kinase [Deltaproteobacteria bacterium]